MLPKKTYSFLK